MVDLEQFREAVKCWRRSAAACGSSDDVKEADRLLSIIDSAWADGVHTCGTHCQRPMCVLRRENAELRERLSQQPEAVVDEAARLLAICQRRETGQFRRGENRQSGPLRINGLQVDRVQPPGRVARPLSGVPAAPGGRARMVQRAAWRSRWVPWRGVGECLRNGRPARGGPLAGFPVNY